MKSIYQTVRYRFFMALSAFICLSGCSQVPNKLEAQQTVKFKNVTTEVGLVTPATWKYGGPTITDINGDGQYDLILGSHHEEPAYTFLKRTDGTYAKQEQPAAKWDVHGIAAGDYDNDGDNDLLVSLGGGNGSSPQPARLLNNQKGELVDVTERAGISELGARGRSVRWLDMDNDGDLDILHITAMPIKETQQPRNVVFENLGNGSFAYKQTKLLEDLEAERLLISDINNDGRLDLITFSPLSIIVRGDSAFEFKDLTQQWLSEFEDKNIDFITAAAEADFDNDGDMDIYLSRGKTYYQIANNAMSYDQPAKRLDIRDEGNKSSDGFTFEAGDEIILSDFFRWFRNVDKGMPLYVGAASKKYDMPKAALVINAEDARGIPKQSETAWYLGYLGDNKWQLNWQLNENYAWDIRASITGVQSPPADWKTQDLSVPDLLLENRGNQFVDSSHKLPPLSNDNNWGVISADFNNDSYSDFFVYRFGELRKRVTDVLLLNQLGQSFDQITNHDATVTGTKAHGDMGAAFDHNDDGFVDILSGDDDQGKWYLFENTGVSNTNYVTLDIAHNENRVGPQNALVELELDDRTLTKRIGSSGSVHSQSLLNHVHFGVGQNTRIKKVTVTYRDGSQLIKTDLATNQRYTFGSSL